MSSLSRRVKRDAAERLRYSVSELSRITDVSVPSIHHYRRLGLLPAPHEAAANRFQYDETHVEALRAIRTLRKRPGLSLAAIGELLPSLLSNQHEQAFRTDMWDEVIAAHLRLAESSSPAAQLVATARKLFSEDGFAHTNVEDITLAAGLAKGTFYRHFASKEEIFLSAVRSVPQAVAEALRRAPSPMEPSQLQRKLEAALHPFAGLVLEATVRAMHGEEGHEGLMGEVTRPLTAEVARRLSPRRSATTASDLVAAALFGVLRLAMGLSRSTTRPLR